MSGSSTTGTSASNATVSSSGTTAAPYPPGPYDPGAQPQVDVPPSFYGDGETEGWGGWDWPDHRPPVPGTDFVIPGSSITQSGTPAGVTITPSLPFLGPTLLPVIVEDGTGYENATSYVTLTYADAYLSANPHFWPVWNSIQETDKANLLMFATRYIDQRTVWNGVRQHFVQALGWPRKDVYDRDGVRVPHSSVPIAVQQATVEMAKFLIAQDRSIERQTDGIKTIEADVVKIYLQETYRLPAVPNHIAFILLGLGMVSSGRNSAARVRRA